MTRASMLLLAMSLGALAAMEVAPQSTAAEPIAWLDRLPDPEAKARIDQWFASADGLQRSAAIHAIATAHRREARPWLAASLTAREPLVVLSSLRALAEFGSPSAESTTTVIGLVLHPDAQVAGAAMRCLASWQEHRAVPAVVRQLASHDEGVVRAARATLIKLRGDDLGPTPAAWQTWHAEEREALNAQFAPLRATLAERGDRPIADVLHAIDRLTLVVGAVDESVEMLRPLLADEEGPVRTAAIRALRTLKPRDEWPVLPEPEPVPVATTAPPEALQAENRNLIGWIGVAVVMTAAASSCFWWVSRLHVPRLPRRTERVRSGQAKGDATPPVDGNASATKPASERSRPKPKLTFTH